MPVLIFLFLLIIGSCTIIQESACQDNGPVWSTEATVYTFAQSGRNNDSFDIWVKTPEGRMGKVSAPDPTYFGLQKGDKVIFTEKKSCNGFVLDSSLKKVMK